MTFLINTLGTRGGEIDPVVQRALSIEGCAAALEWLGRCPEYAVTPLVDLPSLARRAGVASVQIKDESGRLGLASFKALGGAYAVLRIVATEVGRRLDRTIGPRDITAPDVGAHARSLTMCCATDGNHGRSVAAGAGLCGARAIIYVHEGVSDERCAAIARFGAQVERVAGSYDDSVAHAAHMCSDNGWTLVADTSPDMRDPIPLLVMQGYTVMAAEAFDAFPGIPTHVFLQAGVGGMAAAVAAYARSRFGHSAPKIVVVEPDRAACLLESAWSGRLVTIQPAEPTVMAMLQCYEPSRVAWHLLERTATAFMVVDDDEAIAAMRLLAWPSDGSPGITAGESGGAGLAGLTTVARDAKWRSAMKLNANSRVLLINTEGATDPSIYEAILADE